MNKILISIGGESIEVEVSNDSDVCELGKTPAIADETKQDGDGEMT